MLTIRRYFSEAIKSAAYNVRQKRKKKKRVLIAQALDKHSLLAGWWLLIRTPFTVANSSERIVNVAAFVACPAAFGGT